MSFHPRPQRAHELRGVWVATVQNIDWPSQKGLSADQQKAELTAMLDRIAALHLNAVFLQVRPMADALYPSRIEPWSEFLTGTIGGDPGYDPLAFAIEEAHARGLELHAWFNPFRGNRTLLSGALKAYEYGRFVWMDPGDPAVRQRGIDVIADVVRRYDIDGVHMDDYFYPYPENGADFPDDATYQQYGSSMSKDEWRRDNINRFVEQMYATVKSIKPHVEVGISPFGIWRPGHPRQIKGFDAYDGIYADAKLWLRRGWVDYLAPQLYWTIDKREQSFPTLLHWWTREDKLGRGIVAGMSIYRADRNGAQEYARQIQLVREDDGAVGFILFSAKTLMKNTGGVNEAIARAIAR